MSDVTNRRSWTSGFWGVRASTRLQCRFCLADFATEEEAASSCLYSLNGRHELVTRYR